MNNRLFVLLFLFTIYSPQFFCSEKQLAATVITINSSATPGETKVFINRSANPDSIIISVKTDDKAVLKNIKQYIKSIAGINGAYYCDNHNVFIVFESLPQDSPPLTDLLKKQYPTYIIETKSGSVKELMNFCSFNDPADMAGLKAN